MLGRQGTACRLVAVLALVLAARIGPAHVLAAGAAAPRRNLVAAPDALMRLESSIGNDVHQLAADLGLLSEDEQHNGDEAGIVTLEYLPGFNGDVLASHRSLAERPQRAAPAAVPSAQQLPAVKTAARPLTAAAQAAQQKLLNSLTINQARKVIQGMRQGLSFEAAVSLAVRVPPPQPLAVPVPTSGREGSYGNYGSYGGYGNYGAYGGYGSKRL